MAVIKFILLFSLLLISQQETFPEKSGGDAPPPLPVINYNACPFEGCLFRKWVVARDSDTFSTWKDGRKLLSKIRKGDVVVGLTGVHITYEPDRIQVLKPIPELGVQSGGIILRYMYHGEGYADIWVKGQWKREFDCSFITERDGSGCMRGCAAKVVTDGKKDWWVRFKTAGGSIAWAKVKDQFDCMDTFGGNAKCEALNGSPP